jgi:hypothetical protein
MDVDECENGLNGTFVEVPTDPDLPAGWKKKVYQMNGMLVPRWTIWYDIDGNKFVNKIRIKQMLRGKIQEESRTHSVDVDTANGGEKKHRNLDTDMVHCNSDFTLPNEKLEKYLDFDPEVEKEYYGTELNYTDDIDDLADDNDVLSLSDQIIAHYQQQEDYRKHEENNDAIDTDNILERYRKVIKIDETTEMSIGTDHKEKTKKCKQCEQTFIKQKDLLKNMKDHNISNSYRKKRCF